MTLILSLWRWFRERREATARLIDHTERLNDAQRRMTEATGNFLADRIRGVYEEARDA